MSTATHQTFLPWIRRGPAGALMTPQSALTPPPTRADVSLTYQLREGRTVSDARRGDAKDVLGLKMAGPGDVAGLGVDAILRMDPPRNTTDMFPNYIPALEFRAPDLPWMFTPAAADSDDRLLPWIALVCVEDGVEGHIDATGDGTFVLTLTPPTGRSVGGAAAVLPTANEMWAWAHVQLTGFERQTSTLDRLSHFIRNHPDQVMSRILCPRNLLPKRSYVCALVPLFETGRRAGLGLADPDIVGFAWDAASKPGHRLPAYHHWRFSTAAEGDFESLARRLRPTELSPDVGTREVDIQDCGLEMDRILRALRAPARETGAPEGADRDLPFPAALTAKTPTIRLGGALRPAGQNPPDHDDPLEDALTTLFEAPEVDPPVVKPPLYGKHQAGTDRLSANAPGWLATLATTTAHRIAAGLGAEIVRSGQEAFMAEAWEQYGPIEQINALLNRGRLSRALGNDLHKRHLEIETEICGASDAPPDRVLETLAPVLGRLPLGERTVADTMAEGAVHPGGRAFRRALRTAPTLQKPSRTEALRTVRTGPPDVAPLDADIPNTPEIAALVAELAALGPTLSARGSFPSPTQPNWGEINNSICAGLQPDKTIKSRVSSRLGAAVPAFIPKDDPVSPILAAPTIPAPMYVALRDKSQDWILPGLGHVPRNAISLLEPNPAFIEAYMAGLNHEMGAELLWRGFPTDRRGSYFRQFWDTSIAESPPPDIAEMHEWTGALGTHLNADSAPGLMLLIRGELLRRFPSTLIYAAKAAPGGGLDTLTAPRLPLFRGELAPDLTFIAFDLTADEASSPTSPGWYFMLEGPPMEPRFGLDETLDFETGRDAARSFAALGSDYDWDPIYWGDLLNGAAATSDDLDDVTHIPVKPSNATLEGHTANKVTWGHNSAHMAAITRQVDVRIAFHADALIGDAP